MNSEQQERLEMLLAMMAAITGISEEKAQSLLESTLVYENILAGNACILYESPSATLMAAVDELVQKGTDLMVEKITPESVEALNRWMEKNQIYEAAELAEKTCRQGKSSKEKAAVADLLRKRLQSFPSEMQRDVNAWLMSTQNFTEHLFSQWSGCLRIPGPIISGTRGGAFEPVVCDEPAAYGAGNGVYRFSLTQPALLSFSMSLPPAFMRPLFLVVLCLQDERLSRVYPLSLLGSKKLRVRENVELPAGEYVMCVPKIPIGREEDDLADA